MNIFSKFFKALGKSFDIFRKVMLNIVFACLLIFIIVLVYMGSKLPEVPQQAVLVINPKGKIVEELSEDMGNSLQRLAKVDSESEILLKDVLDSIKFAKEDPRIMSIFLELSRMQKTNLTKLQDIGRALNDFKKDGKKVIAYADSYSQQAYYLGAMADEVYLNRLGSLIISGYGIYNAYFKEGLDKLGVEPNVIRAGKYKSAFESFARNDMSAESKEAGGRLISVLWKNYLDDISIARGIKPENLQKQIDNFDQSIKLAAGDMPRFALQAGLIDKTVTRDEIEERLIRMTGEDPKTRSYYKIGCSDYLHALDKDRFGQKKQGDCVAVVTASGIILNGKQPPGTIGGDSTAALIRNAADDENVRAVVLRVDSPGGSAFASEVIRRELELTRKKGKPVVVSMGSLAASGGYWISLASDKIFASPATITGSIGVLSMFPTYQNLLKKRLGMSIDGLGTTKLTGALRPDKELDPKVKSAIQQLIDNVYYQFISKTAAARYKSISEINEIAQGRVWSGIDAKKVGLIDDFGGLQESVDCAARLAKLEDYEVKYILPQHDLKSRIIAEISSWTHEILGIQPTNSYLAEMSEFLYQQYGDIIRLNDPSGVYAYCPLSSSLNSAAFFSFAE